MASPSLEYLFPTNRAFGGMKRVLFVPFQFGKWLVLGFTAWLAGLMDGNGISFNASSDSQSLGAGSPEESFRKANEWVQENLELVIGIGVAVFLLLVALSILLLWISSRGKFMFLDNVIHNRALVKSPWQHSAGRWILHQVR